MSIAFRATLASTETGLREGKEPSAPPNADTEDGTCRAVDRCERHGRTVRRIDTGMSRSCRWHRLRSHHRRQCRVRSVTCFEVSDFTSASRIASSVRARRSLIPCREPRTDLDMGSSNDVRPCEPRPGRMPTPDLAFDDFAPVRDIGVVSRDRRTARCLERSSRSLGPDASIVEVGVSFGPDVCDAAVGTLHRVAGEHRSKNYRVPLSCLC